MKLTEMAYLQRQEKGESGLHELHEGGGERPRRSIKELAECDRTGVGCEESGGFCEWKGYE